MENNENVEETNSKDSIFDPSKTKINFNDKKFPIPENVIAPYFLPNTMNKQNAINPNAIDFPLKENLKMLFNQNNDNLMNEIPKLLYETAETLKELTNSKNFTLYLMDSEYDELYFYDQHQPIMANNSKRISWKIHNDKITISTYVAKTTEAILVNNIIDDDRFPAGIGWRQTLNIEQITNCICIPITMLFGNDCFAIIEFYRVSGENYNLNDLQLCKIYALWIGMAIEQNLKRIRLQIEYELNSYMSKLIEEYLIKKLSFEETLTQIVYLAKKTLNADCGKFFDIFMDKTKNIGLLAHVYVEPNELDWSIDSDHSDDGQTKVMKKKSTKIHFQLEKGIVNECAKTCKTVNAYDVRTDLRYDREIDGFHGKLIKTILCAPIIGMAEEAANEECIGVLELINKLPRGQFNLNDEQLIKLFSIYCNILLHYKRLNDKLIKSETWNLLYNEMLGYHILNPFDDHRNIEIPVDISSFEWYIYPNYYENVCELIIFMIEDCIVMERKDQQRHYWNQLDLLRFVKTVEKCYKNIPYHNFEHAANVMHCIYCILKLYKNEFTTIEKIALLFGALCHDLDHSGFSDNFIELCDSPLASLYNDSILENHHSWFGKFIIQKTKILENVLSASDYKLFMKEFHENILATNLKYNNSIVRPKLINYLKESSSQANDDNNFNAVQTKNCLTNSHFKMLLRGQLMMAADLSGQTKPFKIVKRLVQNLYKEFTNESQLSVEFIQKTSGSKNQNKLKNDHKENLNYRIASEQIQFINDICLPCYDLLKILLPQTEILLENCKTIQNTWKQIIEHKGLKVWNPDDSIFWSESEDGEYDADEDYANAK